MAGRVSLGPAQYTMRQVPLIFLFVTSTANALWPVPDANLRVWISANYPGAMVGNSVDENHPGVQSATDLYMSFSGIASLMGVQAFENAQTLVADNNPIPLSGVFTPPGLLLLSLANCQLSGNLYMDDFAPPSIQALYVQGNQLTSVVWCSSCGLQSFNGDNNQIAALSGTAPLSLSTVKLAFNGLSGNAPGIQGMQLYYLDVSNNALTALPSVAFNAGGVLLAHHNMLSALLPGDLSTSLNSVDVGHNQIDTIGDLYGHAAMTQLFAGNNPLTKGIHEVPSALQTLHLPSTQIPCLPWLPQSLITLLCTGNMFNCLPNMPPSLNASPGNLGFAPALCTSTNPCYIAPPSVRLRACLQGAWNEAAGLMRDDLRVQGLLPLTEPYTALGYNYLMNNTPLSVPAVVFSTAGPNAIVDWVVVEVRQGGMPGTLVQSMPGLVRRDGLVMSTTGDSLHVLRVARGSYKVAVKHRNHLAVINFASQPFWNGHTTIDLFEPGTTQVNAFAVAFTNGGKRLLPMGDVTGDKTVKYTGVANDRDPILTALGGVLPTAVLTGQYRSEDVNMDGQVKYAGANNDRDPVLVAVGGSVPTATRIQVPVF